MTYKKFHFNPKTSALGQCFAKEDNCPFGGESIHSSDRHELLKKVDLFYTSLIKKDNVDFFFIDEKEINDFSRGDCDVLALSLSKEFKRPMIAVYYKGINREGQSYKIGHHVGILLEDGRILDVKGIWSQEKFYEDWKGYNTDENIFISEINEAEFNQYGFKTHQVFDSSLDKVKKRITSFLSETFIRDNSKLLF